MVFIPNFLIDSGKKLILEKEKEFISLMLISGQIKLLKKISKILDLGHSESYIKLKTDTLIKNIWQFLLTTIF